MTVEMNGERLLVRFRPITETGAAFLAEHLDAEAAVPSGLTDAGVVDRVTEVDGEVRLEKSLPPQAGGEI
jgi:hypothetical protein